jgi:hypothetical protein
MLNSIIHEESLTIHRDPPREFNKICVDILDKIDAYISKKKIPSAFFDKNKNKTMKDDDSYIKSVKNAKEELSYRNKSVYEYKLNIMAASSCYMSSSSMIMRAPELFMEDITDIFTSSGFKQVPDSKNFFKGLTDTSQLYRSVNDKLYVVANTSVSYISSYNTFSSFTTLNIEMKAIVPDETSLKGLNLTESSIISEGIFGNLFSNSKQSKKIEYSKEQLDSCAKKVKEIWAKHSSKWKAIIQKELNSSKYGKYYYLGMEEFIYEDYAYTAFLVSVNYLDYDPNLREHFDNGNPIKPLEDFQKIIITKLKEYCSKNKLDFIHFSDDGGDWESTSIDATIPVSALIKMIQEQSSIFESVELI